MKLNKHHFSNLSPLAKTVPWRPSVLASLPDQLLSCLYSYKKTFRCSCWRLNMTKKLYVFR